MAKSDKRLGKGLGALIPDVNYTPAKTVEEAVKTGNVAIIELDKIETNPFQPRANFDETALNELAESIKQLGIIQPITVRLKENGKFQLISGERRLRASKIAGLEKIPAFVREANDQEMLEFALVENIQREDLNPIEIAVTYQRLMEECNLTQEKLSERTGKARSSIANYLRLLKLPPEIQAGLRNMKITMGHAKVISSLSDKHNQLKVFYKVIADGLSVSRTREIVEGIINPQLKDTKKQNKTLPEDFDVIKKQLNEKLNTKVEIKYSDNGKGKLIINFENKDLLEKILNSLE